MRRCTEAVFRKTTLGQSRRAHIADAEREKPGFFLDRDSSFPYAAESSQLCRNWGSEK